MWLYCHSFVIFYFFGETAVRDRIILQVCRRNPNESYYSLALASFRFSCNPIANPKMLATGVKWVGEYINVV